MKKQITRAFALFIMGIILGTSQLASARAAERLFIDVPFDFVAGSRQLPAGRYSVRRVRVDSATALYIRSEDGRQTATLLTIDTGSQVDRAKLVFRQYGDRHFLASLWMPGTASGRGLPESKQERQLRRELLARAEEGGAARTVTVLGSVQ
jgi:hypothetical protein